MIETIIYNTPTVMRIVRASATACKESLHTEFSLEECISAFEAETYMLLLYHCFSFQISSSTFFTTFLFSII